jgi:phosphate transport system substrate-binding protein
MFAQTHCFTFHPKNGGSNMKSFLSTGLAGLFLLALITSLIVMPGCGSDSSNDGDGKSPASSIRISGSGATFPGPLYMRWVSEYAKVATNVRIDYAAIGSGGGIKHIIQKTSHFAGSDAPLKDSEIEKMGGKAAVVEVPSVAGSVVVTYNLPTVSQDLKLTGDLIADIYLRKVTRWNDARIAELNEGVELPDIAITPVSRSDGSGTTFVFTKFLSTQSDEFSQTIGSGKQVQWKSGSQGGKGNQGVTQAVQQVVGGIGYVEFNYASQNKLPSALIKNRSGKFIKSSPETVAAAGAGAADQMSGNILAANIWNQKGENAYPIAAFTYMIVYSDLHNLPDKATAKALADYLWWATHDGQALAGEMDYAPLAPAVQAKVEAALKTLTYKGEALQVGPK